jgi:hypothetical protein
MDHRYEKLDHFIRSKSKWHDVAAMVSPDGEIYNLHNMSHPQFADEVLGMLEIEAYEAGWIRVLIHNQEELCIQMANPSRSRIRKIIGQLIRDNLLGMVELTIEDQFNVSSCYDNALYY